MHKNDFFPFIFFSYHSFSLSYLEPQIIFPCRDIGPATATLDPRPRHWTRDRDFGPTTRDPRLLVKLLIYKQCLSPSLAATKAFYSLLHCYFCSSRKLYRILFRIIIFIFPRLSTAIIGLTVNRTLGDC